MYSIYSPLFFRRRIAALLLRSSELGERKRTGWKFLFFTSCANNSNTCDEEEMKRKPGRRGKNLPSHIWGDLRISIEIGNLFQQLLTAEIERYIIIYLWESDLDISTCDKIIYYKKKKKEISSVMQLHELNDCSPSECFAVFFSASSFEYVKIEVPCLCHNPNCSDVAHSEWSML